MIDHEHAQVATSRLPGGTGLARATIGALVLMLVGCGAGVGTSETPQVSPSASAEPSATPVPDQSPISTPSATPESTPATSVPMEPGNTAWFELYLQMTGVPTVSDDEPSADIHEGHVFIGGTLDAGQTIRLELPEFHAFADGPRDGQSLVGSDDESVSELLLVDAVTVNAESVLSTELIIWGGSLAPDASAIYYVPVDRGSMTDGGLWRLALEPEAEPEQVLEQVTPATYDFASQYHFAWSPDGEHLVAQYCNRRDCVEHIVDSATLESRVVESASVFELRGATNDEFIADANSNGQRTAILAVDFETLEVRTVAGEWGVSEVHQTSEGPLVVYLAPDQPTREMALMGIWLDREEEPFVVYEDRDTDTPPEQDFGRLGAGYQAPEGWMLLWPGSPGAEGAETWEPTFMLLDILSGEELTYPYEVDPPR